MVKGASFDFAREKCKKNNGDLIHGFKGVTTSFILAELERRKEKLKTQLVWIGAQKEPGVVVKTWKWVDGKCFYKFFNILVYFPELFISHLIIFLDRF